MKNGLEKNVDFENLDNPAWGALCSTQQQFSVGTSHSKRYQPGILPFISYDHKNASNIDMLNNFIEKGETFYLIGNMTPLPLDWLVTKELPCLQMILTTPLQSSEKDISIVHLDEYRKKEIYQLIQKVQPGYYELNTYLLGNYYGIFDQENLVAVAGERMRLDGLTEISAICTDPDYTGRGYAQKLIARLCKANLEKGNIPFLHVIDSNERAIKIYELMGFTARRKISFWQIRRSF